MKVMLFSTGAPVGGHFRSMVTIGAALKRRGHKVWIVSSAGPGVRLATEAGIDTEILPRNCYASLEFNWLNFRRLRTIMAALEPEVAHSFAYGIPALILASRGLGTRVTETLCGGPPRRIAPVVAPIIVFNEQLKINMIGLGTPEHEVHVIPGRIDLQHIPPQLDPESFFSSLGLTTGTGPFVFMVCRAAFPKRHALHHFFTAAERFACQGGSGTFVHVGTGTDDQFVAQLREVAFHINQRAGRRVLITTDFASDDPIRLLYFASVVVGMGRSAFEGMLLQKPTLILSNEGFGGAVCPDRIDRLARHNFTARGVLTAEDTKTTSLLVSEITKLLKDNSYASDVANFGHQWCKNYLDVDRAAEQYEEIYRELLDRKLTRPRYFGILKNITYATVRSATYKMRQRTLCFTNV